MFAMRKRERSILYRPLRDRFQVMIAQNGGNYLLWTVAFLAEYIQ